jgi:hypothetical protein
MRRQILIVQIVLKNISLIVEHTDVIEQPFNVDIRVNYDEGGTTISKYAIVKVPPLQVIQKLRLI